MATADNSLLANLLRDITQDGDPPAGWSSEEVGDVLLKFAKENEAEGEEALAKATAGAGARAGGDEEEPSDVPASQIRMVQLFLTVETEPTFKKAVETLQELWETETLTD